jgi:galactitol PTS system EIIA component
MLSADLCVAHFMAESSDDVVRMLAQLLTVAGHVRPSFEAAAIAREKLSPTGLPFPGRAVAMPHADPEHVIVPALAIASLGKPVFFRQMGAPGVKLAVSLVVMPALTSKEQAGGELARLVGLLQDESLRRALTEAETSQSLYEKLQGRLGTA